MTKAAERGRLAEGLAAGCVALGIDNVTTNKFRLETAFNHAWPDWPEHRSFPHVHASLSQCDIVPILTASERRNAQAVAAWEQNGAMWLPHLIEGYDLDDVADLLPKFEPIVSWDAWKRLAERLDAELQTGDSLSR